jgi:calcineurin-like phosphoesterase family protein
MRARLALLSMCGALVVMGSAAAAQAPPACEFVDPCQAPRRAGEVSLVLLGDSGYGEGGASEWGGHEQATVAGRIDALCPRPDLVFFLGDNIYWGGNPDLFGPRFDTMYRNLFDAEHRRVHAALGNHDVKGCQLAAEPGFAIGETCADALERALREDVRRDVATGGAVAPTPAQAAEAAERWVDPDVRERALKVPAPDCPSAFDAGYEQRQAGGEGGSCYASAALRHAQFGFLRRGETPLRYYTVDWPGPIAIGAIPAPSEPRVRVLVADSNTLDVVGGVIPAATGKEAARTDTLQLLWLENQLRTAPADTWTLTVMHHPPFSPRGCVFRFLGQCVGGHDDEKGLAAQLRSTWGVTGSEERSNGTHHPDLVFTAHNHFYARSRSIDGLGYPAMAAGSGVRYFVTGGGGAPLYRQQPLHARYAAGGSFHHFVYLRLQKDTAFFWTIDERGAVKDSACFHRGEVVDRCITSGTFTTATVTCGDVVPASGNCPAPKP